MATISEILSLVREFAPESATEPDFADNVGLTVGSERGDTDKVLLCLDCTENIVDEAKEQGAKLIISHHPAIFYPIKRVTDGDPTGRMILSAAEAGITVYSAHTNLDFCRGGLNDYVAELMELGDVSPMITADGIAIGRVGERKKGSLGAFAKRLADTFDDRHIRIVGGLSAEVRRIAVINGGGGSIEYVRKAAELGADCYVTADAPHHVLLYAAQSGMNLIVMQHFCMEAVYMKRFAEILSKSAAERGVSVRFTVGASEYNPVRQEVL